MTTRPNTPNEPLFDSPLEVWVARGRISQRWEHVHIRDPKTPQFWQRYIREDKAALSEIAPPEGNNAAGEIEQVYKDLMSGALVLVRNWFTNEPYCAQAEQKASQAICRAIKPAPLDRNAVIEEFPEINPNNYDDEDVRRLNEWGIKVYHALKRTAPQAEASSGRPANRAVSDNPAVAARSKMATPPYSEYDRLRDQGPQVSLEHGSGDKPSESPTPRRIGPQYLALSVSGAWVKEWQDCADQLARELAEKEQLRRDQVSSLLATERNSDAELAKCKADLARAIANHAADLSAQSTKRIPLGSLKEMPPHPAIRIFGDDDGAYVHQADYDRLRSYAHRLEATQSATAPLDQHPDTEADGVVFCGKCGAER